MKSIYKFFIVAATFLSAAISSNAQTNPSDKAAIQILKSWYKTFNATCATVRGNDLHKKIDSLQQKYCSVQMLNKMRSLGPEFDLLGFNPYTDVKHLNTLTVTKDPAEEDAYVVSYVEPAAADAKPADSKIVIHVSVEEQADGLKITSIK